MSRHRSAPSYGHTITPQGPGEYVISWTIDFYYSNSRLRYPRRFRRHTDEAGAKRFRRKWGL
jgi:hypothetical protein